MGSTEFFQIKISAARTCNLKAELAVICFGLHQAWEHGSRHLVCYSDSTLALGLSLHPSSANHAYAPLISVIKDMLGRDWVVELTHTLREGNESADILAKMGALQQEQFRVMLTPLAALGASLVADAMEVAHLRA